MADPAPSSAYEAPFDPRTVTEAPQALGRSFALRGAGLVGLATLGVYGVAVASTPLYAAKDAAMGLSLVFTALLLVAGLELKRDELDEFLDLAPSQGSARAVLITGSWVLVAHGALGWALLRIPDVPGFVVFLGALTLGLSFLLAAGAVTFEGTRLLRALTWAPLRACLALSAILPPTRRSHHDVSLSPPAVWTEQRRLGLAYLALAGRAVAGWVLGLIPPALMVGLRVRSPAGHGAVEVFLGATLSAFLVAGGLEHWCQRYLEDLSRRRRES
jgi:hypothetical protein